MFTVMCVLRSGGNYDPSWVRKLRDNVWRHCTRPHRFVCLSDVDVPCARIPLKHDWPGWWSKIELFSDGVITEPTLYLDLDTIVTGPIDGIAELQSDFATIRSFADPSMMGTGIMFFRKVPHQVYTKFVKQPQAYIDHHVRNQRGAYIGDQGFINDVLDRKADVLTDLFAGITSYKLHQKRKLLPGTSIVAFPGEPKPQEVDDEWVKEEWQ